jgi:Bacterial Ig-like domain (group 3)/Right handed beta helix region
MRGIAKLSSPRIAKRNRWFVELGSGLKVTPGPFRERSRLRPNLLELEQRTLLSTFTVTNTLDAITNNIPAMGSLRWAIDAAEADDEPNELINFSSTVFDTPQTISLIMPLPIAMVGPTYTIEGPGADLLTIGGNGAAFQVDAGVKATISGMTISGAGGPGAIDAIGSVTIDDCTLASNGGSGVYVAGTADINDCTISGNNSFAGGGLYVIAGGTVDVTETTITGNTGAIGGGINNEGTATLTDCTISGTINGAGAIYSAGQLTATGCTLYGSSGACVTNKYGIMYLGDSTISDVTNGGGIYSSGQLKVKDCTVSGITGIGVYNEKGTAYVFGSTISGGSGIIFGGDLINQPGATLTLTDCTVSGGSAGAGGAGLYNGGTATVTDCTFSDNFAGGNGAGIGNGFFSTNALLLLTGCTLEGNTSTGAGSGIAISNGTATLIDDTIANNVATNSGPGAGVYNSGTATLVACTISGNTAGGDGAGICEGFGSSQLTLDDTIVVENMSTQTGKALYSDIFNDGGAIISGACNLIGPGGSGGLVNDESGNIILGADVGLNLAPLAENGGPTETIALLKGCPAIENGEPIIGLTSDQRGDPLDSPYPDIGAYQTNTDHGSIVNYIVTSVLDVVSPGTLPWAVAELDTSNRSGTIEFELGTSPATITLTQGQLELSNTFLAIKIIGPTAGLTISGDGASNVFQIDPGVKASISGLDLVQGYATAGGGLYNEGTATLTDCTISGSTGTAEGGGIANTGTITLTDCTISDNLSPDGGGLANAGTATLDACTLSGNVGNVGGGIDNLTAATATLEDTIVASNTSGARTPNDIGGSDPAGVVGTYDLIGTGGSGGIINGDDNDIVLTILKGVGLSTLGSYGGSTQTVALLPGSPAIGAGTDSYGLTTDQRGDPLDSPNPDIGAFQTEGFELTLDTGATPQTAGTGTEFGEPLAVSVTANDPDAPVDGGLVTYAVITASNGAGAVLSLASAFIGSDKVAEVTATANATTGSYTVTASAAGAPTVDFALTNLFPLAFTNVNNQIINYGAASVTVSGTLADGSEIPVGGLVTIILGSNQQQTPVGIDGSFSAVFNTSTLTVVDSPYTISLSYPGSTAFEPAATNNSLTVIPATPTVTVSDAGGTYTGAGFPATASVAGTNGSASSSLEGVSVIVAYYTGTYNDVLQLADLTPLSQTPSIAESYTAVASFEGSADYSSATVMVNFTIASATPTVTVVDAGGTYKNAPFPATDSIKGVSGSAGSSLEGVPLTLSYYGGTYTLPSQLAGLTPLSGAPTVAGAYTAVAKFAGSIDYASTAQLNPFTIAQATPTVTVADAGGTYNGTAFAATDSVKGLSGTAGSTLEGKSLVVDYYSGTYSTASQLAGLAPLSAAPSEAGPFTAAANFPGSTDYANTTQLVNFTIAQATPTVTVTDAGGTYNGAPFTATVTVTGISGTAAASLENITPALAYYSGSYSSPSQLTGLTSLSIVPTQAGLYTVLASFPGSTDYSSASNLAEFAVNKAQPTITWSSPASIVYGTPLGTTQLDASANVAGNLTYNPAPGSFVNAGTGQTLSVTITPTDSVDYASVTATTTITVSKATPTLGLSDPGGHYNGYPFPASVTITGSGADVSPASSLGEVTPTLTYYEGSNTSGTNLGATPPTAAGSYTVVASFAGSANYVPVQSAPVTFTIGVGVPMVSLTSSTTSAVYGQTITLIATVVAGGPPSGTVTFLDDGTPLGTVSLNASGSATLTTALIATGANSVTAIYSGDSLFASANSSAALASISRAATTVVFLPTPVLKKKKVVSEKLTAEIKPAYLDGSLPTGSVTFEILTKKKKKIHTKVLGTAALTGGNATLTLKAKSVVGKVITIVYGGAPDFIASTLTAPKLPKNGR